MVRGVKKQEADSAQNHVVLFMAGKRIMVLHLILVATKLYLWRKIRQGISLIIIFCNLHETLKLMMHLLGYFLDRQVEKTGAE